MRTTWTIDDELFRRVEAAAHQEQRTVRAFVEDALRRALTPRPADPFCQTVHHTSIAAGIDPARLNQLADELEDEATIEQWR